MEQIIFKHFEENDYDKVCDFLIDINKDEEYINWNWARFEWMYEHPEFDVTLKDKIGLWLKDNKIVGIAVFDMYLGEVFCGSLEKELYDEILEYAYRELCDDNGLSISVNLDNKYFIEKLEQKGYKPVDNYIETIMKYNLDKLLSKKLPDGFSYYNPDPIKDYEKMEWLFWQGFDHGNSLEEFAKRDKVKRNVRKHFNQYLIVSVKNEKEEMIAFCSIWYDPKTDFGYVEPVCVIPEYRNKGLGACVVLEALRRVKELGAKQGIVISDNPFYEKIGFHKVSKFQYYNKK